MNPNPRYWPTIGDPYPRSDYEKAAWKMANDRTHVHTQTSCLFSTPHGLLLLEWGRYGWDARWLESAIELDLGPIREEQPAGDTERS